MFIVYQAYCLHCYSQPECWSKVCVCVSTLARSVQVDPLVAHRHSRLVDVNFCSQSALWLLGSEAPTAS